MMFADQCDVDQYGEMIWEWDVSQDKISFPRCFGELLGLNETELVTAHWRNLIYPADQAGFFQVIEQHFQGATEQFVIQHRMIGKDSACAVWMLTRGRIVACNADGSVNRVVGHCSDLRKIKPISGRRLVRQKMLEQAPSVSEESYLSLLNAVKQAVYIQDRAGRFIEINDAAEGLYGIPREEFIGKTPEFLASPGKNDFAFLAEKNRLALAGQPQKFCFFGRRRNGEDFSKEVWLGRGNYFGQVVLIAVANDITGRQLMEETVLAGEEKYRSLYAITRLMCDTLPDMIWAKDTDKRFLFANKSLCARLLSAVDTEEPIGKNDMFFAQRQHVQHPDNPSWHTFGEVCQDSDEIVMRTGQAGKFVESGNVKGEYLILDVVKAPIFDAEAKLIGVVGCGRDVTAQRQAEAALENERILLNSVIRTIPDLVWLKDPEGVYIACNPRFERLFGAKQAEIIGKTDYDFVEQELADFFRRNDQMAVRYGCANSNEEWLTYADDGHRELLETIKTPMYDLQGNFLGVLGIGRDITGHRQVQEDLQASEARYRAMMQQSSDAVGLFDPDTFEIYEINQRFTELTGYSLPADQPLKIWGLIQDQPENINIIRQRIQAGEALDAELRKIKTKDGVIKTVERVTTPILMGEKNIYLLILRPISRERELERMLRKEVEFATRVQKALLPDLPASTYVALRAMYRPCSFVSGDVYYAEWDEQRSLLRGYLVDVTGHGLGTAIQTAAVNVLLHEVAETNLSLEKQLDWLSRRSGQYFAEAAFAAAMAFEIDLAARELRYAGAGITEFMLNGRWILVAGSFLGINMEEEYGVGTLPLQAGDLCLFMTDGMSDILKSIAGGKDSVLPVEQGLEACMQVLNEMAQGSILRDDATVVGLQILGFPD